MAPPGVDIASVIPESSSPSSPAVPVDFSPEDMDFTSSSSSAAESSSPLQRFVPFPNSFSPTDISTASATSPMPASLSSSASPASVAVGQPPVTLFSRAAPLPLQCVRVSSPLSSSPCVMDSSFASQVCSSSSVCASPCVFSASSVSDSTVVLPFPQTSASPPVLSVCVSTDASSSPQRRVCVSSPGFSAPSLTSASAVSSDSAVVLPFPQASASPPVSSVCVSTDASSSPPRRVCVSSPGFSAPSLTYASAVSSDSSALLLRATASSPRVSTLPPPSGVLVSPASQLDGKSAPLLSRECGVVFDTLRDSSIDDYFSALSVFVPASAIVFGSRVAGSFTVYFSTPSWAETVCLRGVSIRGALVFARPLSASPCRVTLSNVPPEVPTAFLTSLLQRYGRVVGPVRFLKSASRLPQFSHVLGFRRMVLMDFADADPTSALPRSISVVHDSVRYTFYVAVAVSCAVCRSSSHASARCPRRVSSPSSVPSVVSATDVSSVVLSPLPSPSLVVPSALSPSPVVSAPAVVSPSPSLAGVSSSPPAMVAAPGSVLPPPSCVAAAVSVGAAPVDSSVLASPPPLDLSVSPPPPLVAVSVSVSSSDMAVSVLSPPPSPAPSFQPALSSAVAPPISQVDSPSSVAVSPLPPADLLPPPSPPVLACELSSSLQSSRRPLSPSALTSVAKKSPPSRGFLPEPPPTYLRRPISSTSFPSDAFHPSNVPQGVLSVPYFQDFVTTVNPDFVLEAALFYTDNIPSLVNQLSEYTVSHSGPAYKRLRSRLNVLISDLEAQFYGYG